MKRIVYIWSQGFQLEFTMDKRDENSWDLLVPQILKALKISFDKNV